MPPYPNHYPGTETKYCFQEWLTEEELVIAKAKVKQREIEIRLMLRHMLGVDDPVRILKSSKKKEYYCNEGSAENRCTVRTSNLGSHLRSGIHNISKENARFVVLLKVSKLLFSIIIKYPRVATLIRVLKIISLLPNS